ncbi:hypothetical protein Goari_022069 [Gossypium aridum]|uniref:Uncharacterized protein n=1 Tax=Gossypium aridum TaxID=34290 RepID=A0A7J8YPN1_GOSAI|nr:hypothetical protein [Gossypium aridum]
MKRFAPNPMATPEYDWCWVKESMTMSLCQVKKTLGQ